MAAVSCIIWQTHNIVQFSHKNTHTPGAYPVEAVTIMSKIAPEAEAALFHRNRFDELRRLTPKPTTTVQTTAIAAVDASFAQNVAAIITLTMNGRL